MWAGGSEDSPAASRSTPRSSSRPSARSFRSRCARWPAAGRSCARGIHMSDIPSFPYSDLWEERIVRSVANLTRRTPRSSSRWLHGAGAHARHDLPPRAGQRGARGPARAGASRAPRCSCLKRASRSAVADSEVGFEQVRRCLPAITARRRALRRNVFWRRRAATRRSSSRAPRVPVQTTSRAARSSRPARRSPTCASLQRRGRRGAITPALSGFSSATQPGFSACEDPARDVCTARRSAPQGVLAAPRDGARAAWRARGGARAGDRRRRRRGEQAHRRAPELQRGPSRAGRRAGRAAGRLRRRRAAGGLRSERAPRAGADRRPRQQPPARGQPARHDPVEVSRSRRARRRRNVPAARRRLLRAERQARDRHRGGRLRDQRDRPRRATDRLPLRASRRARLRAGLRPQSRRRASK